MSTVSVVPDSIAPEVEGRLLLRSVEWSAYRQISEALSGRHVRLTYDRGNLEFMNISRLHGSSSRLLGRFIIVLTEECQLPLSSCGDMTCDREDLERGLEADECFYIVNEPLVREKDRIDLTTDPPPDLAVEVDISRSSLNRLRIYEDLQVPEVWRFDGQTLVIYQLGPDGRYVPVEQSRYFPAISADEIAAFLRRRTEMDENSLVRLFRDRVRELLPER